MAQPKPSATLPLWRGSVWMVGLTVALFFLPLVNGLMGGFVGGFQMRSPKRAFQAAVFPVIGVSAALWVLISILNLPWRGYFNQIHTEVLVLTAVLGMFLGAFIGGLIAQKNYPTA